MVGGRFIAGTSSAARIAMMAITEAQ